VTWRARAAAVVLALGAFGLRAWALAGQSLWSDEDITLDRTALTLGALWRDLPVEHGIGYFALMRGWTRLAGDGDMALRLPSALAGTVLVVLVLVLAQRLAGGRAGWFAGCATAASPFLVSYSQEARMYALLAALGVGALAAVERARAGRWAAWAAAGGLTALAVHVHAFGVLVVAILGLVAVGDLSGRWRRPPAVPAERAGRGAMARGWLLAAVTAAVVLLPVLPRLIGLATAGGSLMDRDWLVAGAGDQAAATALPWLLGPPVLAGRLVGAWTAQTAVTAMRPLAPAELLATVLVALAAAVGVAMLARRAARRDDAGRRAMLALGWLLVPLAAGAVLAASGATLHPRYLILGAPALYTAAGAGLARVPGRAMLALGTTLVLVAALPMAGWFGDPAAQKRDYRALVATVDATTDGRDSVLLLDGPSMGLTKRYLPGGSPLKLENLQSETNARRDAAGFEARLAALVERRPNVWLSTDGAAATSAREWAAGHLFAMGATGLQDVTLRRYAAAGASGQAGIPQPASIGCLASEPLGWTEADATTSGTGSAPSVLCLQASVAAPDQMSTGDVIRVWLRWLPSHGWPSAAAAGNEHRISVRLVDAAGTVVASLDGQPVDWTRPTTGWRSGDAIDDRYALVVPEDAPPGRYAIELTLYDEATLRPLLPLVRLDQTVEVAASGAAP